MLVEWYKMEDNTNNSKCISISDNSNKTTYYIDLPSALQTATAFHITKQ